MELLGGAEEVVEGAIGEFGGERSMGGAILYRSVLRQWFPDGGLSNDRSGLVSIAPDIKSLCVGVAKARRRGLFP